MATYLFFALINDYIMKFKEYFNWKEIWKNKNFKKVNFSFLKSNL